MFEGNAVPPQGRQSRCARGVARGCSGSLDGLAPIGTEYDKWVAESREKFQTTDSNRASTIGNASRKMLAMVEACCWHANEEGRKWETGFQRSRLAPR